MKKVISFVSIAIAAALCSTSAPFVFAADTGSAEELLEKYQDCYAVEETAYHAPEDYVNPALIEKTELVRAADSMYYRANGKQYTAFWTPAADEHYSLNEWCDYADGTYTKRSYHDCEKAEGIYFGLQNDNTYAVAGADYDYFIENGMTVLNIPAELDGKPVTRIAKSAFSYAKYQWKDLQEIILPDSIQRICADAFNRAFADCSVDCKINMPQNIRYLGNGAFYNAMLAFGDTLILPDSIEYVHWNALQDHDSTNREYVKVIVPEHPFLTTDGNIRTLSGVDESVVTGDQMLSIIDAIPYVIEHHPESIKPYETDAVPVVTEPTEPAWVSAKADNAQAVKSITMGDVSCDGAIDVSDAVLLARFLAEDTSAKITDNGIASADINSDGSINGDDVLTILKIIAKIS